MKKFVSINNPIVKKLSTLLDFFILNIEFIVTSLPIIFIFGNLVALNSTMRRYLKNPDISVEKIYIQEMKQNMSLGIKLFFIYVPILFLVFVSFFASISMTGAVSLYSTVMGILAIILLTITINSSLIYFSRYEGALLPSIKNSMKIGIQSIKIILSSLTILLIILEAMKPKGLLTLLYLLPLGFFSCLSYLNYKMVCSVFQKYE